MKDLARITDLVSEWTHEREAELPGHPCAKRLRRTLVTILGMVLVAAIALIDYHTGSKLSITMLYLIPVAAAAWYGGFAHGVLVALASALAWSLVDFVEATPVLTVVRLTNGIIRFGTFAIASSVLARLRVSLVREQLLSRTDPLTGALNRRTYFEAIALEGERSLRTGQPLSLAYLDLDNFKLLNDRLGHLTGDKALVHVVETLQKHLRMNDLVARLGGDEFGLLLPDTDADGTIQLLTRLQRLLSQAMAKQGWPVTVSAGAATFLKPPRDVDQMVQHVDSLMYKVKKNGKNRIDHLTVTEMDEAISLGGNNVERRVAVRVQCHHPARVVIGEGGDLAEEIATVINLSRTGIAFQVNRKIAPTTLVTVENLHDSGPKLLIARVVRQAPAGNDWFHGCELTWQLSDEDVHAWVVGQAETARC